MTQSKDKTIIVKDILYDLSLRLNADRLFTVVNASESKIVILDFADLQTATHSFVHQYVRNRQKSSKILYEINIHSNVKDMFNIVDTTKKQMRFDFSTWSVIDLHLS